MEFSSDDEPISNLKRQTHRGFQADRYEQIRQHRTKFQQDPDQSVHQTRHVQAPSAKQEPTEQEIFYNFPQTTTEQQQQYVEQRAKEQAATNLFLNGLRRAVQKHLSNQPVETPPLPQFAYNNTTRELSRLHGYPPYHVTQTQDKLDQPNHLNDHLEYHVSLYEHNLIRDEKKRRLSPSASDNTGSSTGGLYLSVVIGGTILRYKKLKQLPTCLHLFSCSFYPTNIQPITEPKSRVEIRVAP